MKMIKDKISPEIKSKFLKTINLTKETGNEHGFYLCKSNNKLITSRIISGVDHRLDMGDPSIECKGKKTLGSFHTHGYLSAFKQISKLNSHGISEEKAKRIIEKKHEEYLEENRIDEVTIDSPSPKDVARSILHKCSGMSEGSMCVTSDLGNNKIECWTPKENIPEEDCDRAFKTLYSKNGEKEIVEYRSWMIPLFDKETIKLSDNQQ